MRLILLAVISSLSIIGASFAQTDVTSRSTVFPGPYYGEVIRIIDGDTVEVNVALWPGLRAEYSVRVRGIDAPEISRPDCEAEAEWGARAQQQAERLYRVGLEVRLEDVQYDAFSGRVVADLRREGADRWHQFAREMLDRGMAVEWYPGQSDVPWCLLAQESTEDTPEFENDAEAAE